VVAHVPGATTLGKPGGTTGPPSRPCADSVEVFTLLASLSDSRPTFFFALLTVHCSWITFCSKFSTPRYRVLCSRRSPRKVIMSQGVPASASQQDLAKSLDSFSAQRPKTDAELCAWMSLRAYCDHYPNFAFDQDKIT